MPKHEPCDKCGWEHGGFHICLDRPKEEMEKVVLSAKQVKANDELRYKPESESKVVKDRETRKHRVRKRKTGTPGPRSPEMRAKRDAKIIALYKTGDIGMMPIAKQLGVSRDIVLHVLHKAEERGEVRIRPRGVTTQHDNDRLQNVERDAEVVRLYKEGGMGYEKVAKQMGLSPHKVRGILERAVAAGEVTMRPRPKSWQTG